MTNPLEDIENKKAQNDIGILGYRVYQGAKSDGASRIEAFTLLVAWFKAMLIPNDNYNDET